MNCSKHWLCAHANDNIDCVFKLPRALFVSELVAPDTIPDDDMVEMQRLYQLAFDRRVAARLAALVREQMVMARFVCPEAQQNRAKQLEQAFGSQPNW